MWEKGMKLGFVCCSYDIRLGPKGRDDVSVIALESDAVR